MKHKKLCEKLRISIPPQTMQDLTESVFINIKENSKKRHPHSQFRGLDLFFDLLSEQEISVVDVTNPHDYQIRFEIEDNTGINGKFMIHCKDDGSLHEPKGIGLLPSSLSDKMLLFSKEWLEMRPYAYKIKSRKSITSVEKIRLALAKPRLGLQISENLNQEHVLPSDDKWWRGESAVCDYLFNKLREEHGDSCEVNWDGTQCIISIKGREVAIIIWHERDWSLGEVPVNNPGFDIEVIQGGQSCFHEVKTGNRPKLTPGEQDHAIQVGKDNYFVWHANMNLRPPEITSLPFWDLLQNRVPELKLDSHKEDSEAKTAMEETTRNQQKSGWFWGTGRRKRAVARVRIRPGSGVLIINNRSLVDYFTELKYHQSIQSLFEKTNTKNALDVFVNVKGGGQTGQADAIVLGLGRALKELDSSLDPILRANGYLTRDPRKVERKKPGQPGARKRFQFSKR